MIQEFFEFGHDRASAGPQVWIMTLQVPDDGYQPLRRSAVLPTSLRRALLPLKHHHLCEKPADGKNVRRRTIAVECGHLGRPEVSVAIVRTVRRDCADDLSFAEIGYKDGGGLGPSVVPRESIALADEYVVPVDVPGDVIVSFIYEIHHCAHKPVDNICFVQLLHRRE